MYTTKMFWGDESAETMLKLLEECRIFGVTKVTKNKVTLEEFCDNSFRVELRKEQLLALSEEIRLLANGLVETLPTHIRGTNPYSFRAGEWATIVRVQKIAPDNLPEREVYVCKYLDGFEDFIVISDTENYEVSY